MISLKNQRIQESESNDRFKYQTFKEVVFRLAEIYHQHIEKCLNEEERAEKILEHSYIMLHIYWTDVSLKED
jgi:hypothetical protein